MVMAALPFMLLLVLGRFLRLVWLKYGLRRACHVYFVAYSVISTYVVLKILLKRVLRRASARSILPFVAVVGTALWNVLVAAAVMREARVRAMGVSTAVEVINQLAGLVPPGQLGDLGRLQAARAVGCAIVRRRTLHPNRQTMLEHIVERFDLAQVREAGVLDDPDDFFEAMGRLSEAEQALVLGVVCLAVSINGKMRAADKRFYQAALLECNRGERRFRDNTTLLEEIALAFSSGRPISVQTILVATGTKLPAGERDSVRVRNCPRSRGAFRRPQRSS